MPEFSAENYEKALGLLYDYLRLKGGFVRESLRCGICGNRVEKYSKGCCELCRRLLRRKNEIMGKEKRD